MAIHMLCVWFIATSIWALGSAGCSSQQRSRPPWNGSSPELGAFLQQERCLHSYQDGSVPDVDFVALVVRPWSSAGLGPLGPLGRQARRARQARRTRWGSMRFLEGDLVGILSRSSKIPDFLEVLARRSCGYPSEILCCRGVCEEILRTSCWNPLKDICAKI